MGYCALGGVIGDDVSGVCEDVSEANGLGETTAGSETAHTMLSEPRRVGAVAASARACSSIENFFHFPFLHLYILICVNAKSLFVS